MFLTPRVFFSQHHFSASLSPGFSLNRSLKMADAGSMVVRLPKEDVERDVPPVHKKPETTKTALAAGMAAVRISCFTR